jgi:hypothetical protein
MNIPFYFCILLLLPLQSVNGFTLIGEWEAVIINEAVEGGMYQRWQFRQDKSLVETGGIRWRGTYKVEGHRLINSSSKFLKEAEEFRIEGNILILKSDEGEEIRLKRLSPRSRSTADIVGRWGEKFDFFGPNGLIEIGLTEDGRIKVTMQRQPVAGRYKVGNNLLTIIEQSGTTKHRFRFKNGFLLVKSLDEQNTEEKRFRRIR